MVRIDILRIFEKHLPGDAVSYCYDLWKTYQFVFIAATPRRTKLGDFRVERGTDFTITVNNDLNPHAFLITYLHEVAHLLVFQRYRRIGRPHGPAWKKMFRDVMQPVLHEAVFPISVLTPLKNYLSNPAASTGAHPALTRALRQLDIKPDGQQLLVEMPEGETFRFLQKEYIRGMKRRTRVVCTEKTTGLKVSIWAHVWVEKTE
ncbi:SprT-like domain-containing protein [Larkinella terrae]|uniref:SprT domain-containing protein n=1 Tax=Larkinella terrae TaxID=2025311 RepID=A0A7K0EI47_9BACT|nr:SprT-like domain-containing protein [Larkinella terrae]MRS61487.1 sprT domain-containing protein [Larkinella terrae]